MKVESIEYIHRLLNEKQKTAESARRLAFSLLKSGEQSGSENLPQLKSNYLAAKERHEIITTVLVDFENHDF